MQGDRCSNDISFTWGYNQWKVLRTAEFVTQICVGWNRRNAARERIGTDIKVSLIHLVMLITEVFARAKSRAASH